MDPLEIILKEYEMIRQEILASMSNRTSILSFGLATIGAILTASIATFSVSGYSLLAILMLIFAVPAINGFILFMWAGEYQRMLRAGKFLKGLERKVNREFSDEVLTWETYLSLQRLHMKYPYNTTVLLLLVISLISLSLGLIFLHLPAYLKLIIGVAALALHLAIYRYTVSTFAKLR
jgi:hypothetical protein